jgi:hypothetical protein
MNENINSFREHESLVRLGKVNASVVVSVLITDRYLGLAFSITND